MNLKVLDSNIKYRYNWLQLVYPGMRYMLAHDYGPHGACWHSDTCSGQNRNIYVAAAMLHAVNTTHLNIIDMKFMESGHSMMEVDSMHAAIETKRKHQKLYNISHEWAMICTAARERKPHHVTELNFADFQDFHKLADRIVLNRNMSTSGQEVKWLDVKWFRFITAKPNNILVKERLTDAEFQEIEINRSVAKRESTRIRQSANAIQPANAVHTDTSIHPDVAHICCKEG